MGPSELQFKPLNLKGCGRLGDSQITVVETQAGHGAPDCRLQTDSQSGRQPNSVLLVVPHAKHGNH